MGLFRPVESIIAGTAMLGLITTFSTAHASNFKIIHTFTGGGDGGYPASSPLFRDANGSFYGAMGLPDVFGTLYKLSPNGAVTVLYEFPGDEGGGPNGVILDKKGDLWGTTCCGGGSDCGVIFKLNPKGHETLVHTFGGPPDDGCTPYANLTIDANGVFYGTTTRGGKSRDGTAFELTPKGREKVIHAFKGGRQGYYVNAGLTFGGEGNLYGVTDYGGGKASAGTIFELSVGGTETPLYDFKGSPHDGAIPTAKLIVDGSGNLFGTTLGGGRPGCYAGSGCGVVFKLTPDDAETVLHVFEGGRKDGANPDSGVIVDNAGNLYGTTAYGGSGNACNGSIGCGTVFEIASDGRETILHALNEAKDGANPGGLTADGSGNYYGTTSQGGAYGYGTVFEITP